MDRRSPRQPLDRLAKIYVGSSTEPLPCRVRDISRGGAKLHLFWKQCLPNTFELSDSLSPARRTVRVVWVGQTGVGVRFVDEELSTLPAKSKTFGRRQR